MHKLWCMYSVESYSAVRREILPFSTTWMDLEGNMPSEISQKEKYKSNFK